MGDSKRFWIGFNLVPGIGPARIRLLLETFGNLENAWRAKPYALKQAGIPEKYVQGLAAFRESVDLEAEEQRILDAGFSVLTWDDPGYPQRLLEIFAPPPLLYVQGELEHQDRLAVAMVGTRRASAYGRAVAEEVATNLARNGITIISGLARGIDAIAHRAALQAGGRTIAVLGSGLNRIYPNEHRRLAKDISEQGAVVSDYPLDTQPEGKNFPPRNRIISGLSLAVIVVEAGESSGALITSDFAAEQGRDVFAVPGDIFRPGSRGTNSLIRSGAAPLLSTDDVLERLNMELVARQEHAVEVLPEDPIEREVLAMLSDEPLHVDEIGIKAGLPPAEVASSLAMLELKGRVRQMGGMHYILAREASAQYRVE
ncbi:MAG: DNA-processing protein DprA [Anaerolineales bacterium]|nr:DNA-processing protein DprA [Anaerolineales bacterium]